MTRNQQVHTLRALYQKLMLHIISGIASDDRMNIECVKCALNAFSNSPCRTVVLIGFIAKSDGTACCKKNNALPSEMSLPCCGEYL